jgi:hypothetical protein
MKSKTLRFTTKNKTKKNNKIQIGGSDFSEDALIREINERMDFLPNQKNEVSEYNISRVAQDLYRREKPIIKPGLSITGRVLQIENLGGTTSTDYKNAGMREQASTMMDLNELEILQDSYLVLNTLHGMHSNNLKTVPANTIICFLSSIDYLIYSNPVKNNGVFDFIEGLNKDKYIQLFKKNIALTDQDLSFTTYNDDLGERTIYSHLPVYNCFLDSMWYFPGQLYPDLNNNLSHNDPLVGGIDFISYDHQKQNFIYAEDSNYYHYQNIKDKYFVEGETNDYRIILSDLVNYEKTDMNKKYKLILVSSCRQLEQYDKRHFLSLEVYTYHLNKRLKNTKLNDYSSNVKLTPQCAYISSQKYYIVNRQFGAIFLNNKTKNDNYSGKIPRLQKIYNEDAYREGELIYLSSLSFMKLYKFLAKLGEKSQEKQTQIIRGLIFSCYKILNDNFIKFMEGLYNFTIMTKSYDPEDCKFKDIFKYMRDLNHLLGRNSPLLGIFMHHKIDEYYSNYHHRQYYSGMVTDTGLPTTSFEGDPSRRNTILYKSIISLDVKIDQRIKTLLLGNKTIIRTSDVYKYNYINKIVIFRDLEITGQEVGPQGLIDFLLGVFPKLRILIFRNCYKSQISFNITQKNTTIKELKIINANVIINKISNLTNLENYEIINNEGIMNVMIDSNMKKLNYIHLEHLSNLQNINITNKKFSMERLSLVGNLENLKNLRIETKKLNELSIRDCNLNLSTDFKIDIPDYFKCKLLELVNTKITISLLETLLTNPRKIIFYRKYASLKMNHIDIIGTNAKKKLLNIIYDNASAEIFYITIGDSLLNIENTDLAGWRKKKNKVVILSDHLNQSLSLKNRNYFTVF